MPSGSAQEASGTEEVIGHLEANNVGQRDPRERRSEGFQGFERSTDLGDAFFLRRSSKC